MSGANAVAAMKPGVAGDHDPGDFFDGYTFDGYIAGQPGVYEPLEFTYRPIDRVTERRCGTKKSQLVRDQRLSDEEKEVRLGMLDDEMLAGNIQTWNLIDSRGEPIAVSAAALFRYFPRHRYDRLCQIVLLGVASDPKPAAAMGEAGGGETIGGASDNGPKPEPGDLEAAQGNSGAV